MYRSFTLFVPSVPRLFLPSVHERNRVSLAFGSLEDFARLVSDSLTCATVRVVLIVDCSLGLLVLWLLVVSGHVPLRLLWLIPTASALTKLTTAKMLIENSVHTIETSTGPMRVDLVSPKVPGYPKVGLLRRHVEKALRS